MKGLEEFSDNDLRCELTRRAWAVLTAQVKDLEKQLATAIEADDPDGWIVAARRLLVRYPTAKEEFVVPMWFYSKLSALCEERSARLGDDARKSEGIMTIRRVPIRAV